MGVSTNPPLGQTPSQTVGPYFAYGLTPGQYLYPYRSLFDGTLADPRTPGTPILIVGQVLDGESRPIDDAMIEISQADSAGVRIRSPDDVAASGFRGFGRVGTGTDRERRFVFRTIKPGQVEPRLAPFVDVLVFMRGLLSHAYTRLYFDDEAAANDRDPVLASVPPQRRDTLIARREPAPGAIVYRFDIRMQGPQETVFFDV
ncbi:MAG TPA: protocatechuate 3,4-dioxygenase subunit alpha [Burkholderiaceae bacterium]|jgi:protocatechuate 3,4-dioxygenase, alpha subunit|nr:protocatechuate 3,4-dioxygenase subunit alpha [Burkholderiaceae bacterium]